jgi:hypothetical protein
MPHAFFALIRYQRARIVGGAASTNEGSVRAQA